MGPALTLHTCRNRLYLSAQVTSRTKKDNSLRYAETAALLSDANAWYTHIHERLVVTRYLESEVVQMYSVSRELDRMPSEKHSRCIERIVAQNKLVCAERFTLVVFFGRSLNRSTSK